MIITIRTAVMCAALLLSYFTYSFLACSMCTYIERNSGNNEKETVAND
ncbi:MAG: hypothetical protein LUC92_10570 [Clostridiales bacterium]|nr:hypothetical protein [Clostridiales bacterium]